MLAIGVVVSAKIFLRNAFLRVPKYIRRYELPIRVEFICYEGENYKNNIALRTDTVKLFKEYFVIKVFCNVSEYATLILR